MQTHLLEPNCRQASLSRRLQVRVRSTFCSRARTNHAKDIETASLSLGVGHRLFRESIRKTQDRLRGCLEALSGHLTEAGFGDISEIFDGDPPIVRAAASFKPGALRKFCEPPSNTAPVEKRRKPGWSRRGFRTTSL